MKPNIVNLKKIIFTCLVSFSAFPSAQARDLCNRDGMKTHINACINLTTPSEYQQAGLDDLLKGRFCGKGELARDGMFRCQGDNSDAIKDILGCGAPAILEVAISQIPDTDPRKPASCN